MTQYKPVKATVGAVVVSERGVLLERRNNEPFSDYWCIPGGHIEFGEEVEPALDREVREETGLLVTDRKVLGYYTEYFPELEWHAVALVFIVHVSGTETRQEEEVKELEWVPAQEAATRTLAFRHREILEDYLAHSAD